MGEKLDSGFHIGALLSGEGLGPEKVVTNISENKSQSFLGYQDLGNKRIMIYTYSDTYDPSLINSNLRSHNVWIQF